MGRIVSEKRGKRPWIELTLDAVVRFKHHLVKVTDKPRGVEPTPAQEAQCPEAEAGSQSRETITTLPIIVGGEKSRAGVKRTGITGTGSERCGSSITLAVTTRAGTGSRERIPLRLR